MPPAVRKLVPTDLDAVATTLANAFADDPIFEFLTPNMTPEQRAPRLRPFFKVDTKHRHRLDTVWTTDGQEGAALWAPPGHWKTSIREGLELAWPIIRGTKGRALSALSVLATVEKAHPREPHWYLAVLGTDPAHQGKGIGSSVIAPVLELCDKEGIPAYLESSKVTNVPYYERFGFRVMRDLQLPKGGPVLPLMWRDPQ
jgi:ribosomal protein S18 acetylase RimI-like enzyme